MVISEIWQRFLPYLVPSIRAKDYQNRIVPIPDRGAIIKFGKCFVTALPAHFLHSVGNLHFYDKSSKILFTGDVGASLTEVNDDKPVTDFDRHCDAMQDFHQQYMASNTICRLWVRMVRQLDIEMMVPQHGRPFVGKTMVINFQNWYEKLECGIDRMTDESYQVPHI